MKAHTRQSTMLRFGILILSLIALIAPARMMTAQTEQLCFDVPGITNCITGRFRQYWEQNGGLDVFGYPISAAANVQTPEGTFLTQYFQRNSFELHPEEAQPYDVLLGRLGDTLLRAQGINWQTLPKADPSAPHYFAETGHAVSHDPFWQYWSSHGLQDPALNSYQRSLALFGFPLTEAATATNSSGDTVLTQWFERARFEYHPSNPDPYKVLLGLLGTEIQSTVNPTPTPTPTPTPPTQRTIAIDSPQPNSTVNGAFDVLGRTSYWPNEGNLNYRVQTTNGTVLGSGAIQVQGTFPNPATFTKSISFSSPGSSQTIRFEVYDQDEGNGSIVASAAIALQYVSTPQELHIDVDEPDEGAIVQDSPIRVQGSTSRQTNDERLYYRFVDDEGDIIGEGDFEVDDDRDFDSDASFEAPDSAQTIRLELFEREDDGDRYGTTSINLHFQPAEQSITIDSPQAGTTVGRTFTATGKTTLYPNGGRLIYGVFDQTGQRIGQNDIAVERDGNGSRWSAQVTFDGAENGEPISLAVLEPGTGGRAPVARIEIQLQCCLVGGE